MMPTCRKMSSLIWTAVGILLFSSLIYGQEDTTMSISTEEPVPDTGISCRNGGFPMSDGVSITDCNCPRYWGSDPEQANATMCDVRICVNGGYNDPVKDVCVCPQGYLGVHCEATRNLRPPIGTYLLGKPTFNLFVFSVLSFESAGTLSQLKATVGNDVAIANSVYGGYTLFDYSEQPNPVVQRPPDRTTFLAAVNFISATNPANYSCYSSSIYAQIRRQIMVGRLRQTTLTIFTEHPDDSMEDLASLRLIAVAFSVQLNFLFTTTKFFEPQCDYTKDRFTAMVRLAMDTGGNVLIMSSDNPKPMIDHAIGNSANVQLMYMKRIADCSIQTSWPMAADAFIGDYYAVVRSKSCSTSVTVILLRPATLIANSVTDDLCIYRLNAIIGLTMNIFVQTNISNEECAVQVYQNAMDGQSVLYGLRTFTSFVSDASIDSAYAVMSPGIQLQLSLHVEVAPYTAIQPAIAQVQVASVSYVTDDGPNQLQLVARDFSAFEQVTSTVGPCVAGQNAWFELQVNSVDVNGLQRNFTRYLPSPCPAKVQTVTAAPQTTTIGTPETTITPTLSPGGCTLNDANPYAPQTTLTVIVSNQIPQSTWKTYISYGYLFLNAAARSKYQNFMLVNYDRFVDNVSQEPNAKSYSDYSAFYTAVSNLSLSFAETNRPTDIKCAIQKALKDEFAGTVTKTVTSRSGILIFGATLRGNWDDTRCAATVKNEELLQYLTANRQQVVYIIDIANYNNDTATGLDGNFYMQLTTMTNGHFILFNLTSWTGDNAYIEDFMYDYYSNISGQDLVLAGDVITDGDQAFLGTLDLTNAVGQRTFTMSFTSISQNASFTSTVSGLIQIRGQNGFTSRPPVGVIPPSTLTNFNMQTITLAGGDRYSFYWLHPVPKQVLQLRLWRPYSTMGPGLQYRFVDYRNATATAINPDSVLGATLRGTAENMTPTQVNVTYYDCNGMVVRFENQLIPMTPKEKNCSDIYGGPFFCKNSQPYTACMYNTMDPDTDVLQPFYRMQLNFISQGVNHQYYASFICNKAVVDAILCDGAGFDPQNPTACKCDGLPNLGGPLCDVPDCNSNGPLQYVSGTDDNDTIPIKERYKCNCESGFDGEFCQFGKCTTPNTKPNAIDGWFRTLTVMVAITAQTDTNFANILRSGFILNITGMRTDPLWQYHLLVFGSGSDPRTVYLGGNSVDFQAAFARVADNSFKSIYNTSVDEINFHEAIGYANKYVGSLVRGIYWILSPTAGILNVNYTEAIRMLQPYRQQLYISALSEGKPAYEDKYVTTSNVAYLTGGQQVDFDTYANGVQFASAFLTDLLSSQVSTNFMYEPGADMDKIVIERARGDLRSVRYLVTISSFSALADIKVTADEHPPEQPCADYVFGDPLPTVCVVAYHNGYTQHFICSTNGAPYITITGIDSANTTTQAVIRVLNGITPVFEFVERINEDEPTALPVIQTSANQRKNDVIIYWHREEHIVDPTNYFSNRTTCTFTYNDVLDNSTRLELKFHTSLCLEAPPVEKIFSFPSADIIVCENGGSYRPGDVRCSCPSSFTGPSCNQAVCNNGGMGNTWGTVCDCTGTEMGGTSCSD